MKVWIFFELPVVTRHVSEPYIRTNLTLELKTLSLVCVEMTGLPNWTKDGKGLSGFPAPFCNVLVCSSFLACPTSGV